MKVLGIESTCDETACAIVEDGRLLLSQVIASQIDLHQLYGGVFPELACRRHIDTIIPVITDTLKKAGLSPQDIDLIAVAKGPGLIGALLIGLNVTKALSLAWGIPFIGVNHIEAHLYAAMMPIETPILPALGVVISGGHTLMAHIHALGHYTLIGTTVDDAIGEAFDKVATLLGLPYPGGPVIEKLALEGDAQAFAFKPGSVKGRPLDFSFSGLKTHVLYTVKGANSSKGSPTILPEHQKKDVAASFQETALGDIVSKSLKAARLYDLQAIYVGGGVSQNQYLRVCYQRALSRMGLEIPIYFPPPALSTDNAAMIAGLGYHVFLRQGHGDPLDLEPMIRIPL